MKGFLKDLIIILLLTIAAILILGILLYRYLPTNKIIPEKVSYSTPETVSSELNNNSNLDEPLTVPYTVTSSDLTNYKKTQQYVPGKKNPFAPYSATDANNAISSTNGNNTNSSSTSGNVNTNEGYLPSRGTK